jgi:CRP/FNR family cyclic AMP-dependent transcriptional regulator
LNLDPSAFVADPALIAGLDQESTPISCADDLVLFRQGDAPVGLHILKSGQARLTMAAADSTEVLSFVAGPGSLLGLPGLIGNEPYTLTATAQAGAELGFVTRERFTAFMSSNPMLAFKILQILAAEVRTARNAIFQR